MRRARCNELDCDLGAPVIKSTRGFCAKNVRTVGKQSVTQAETSLLCTSCLPTPTIDVHFCVHPFARKDSTTAEKVWTFSGDTRTMSMRAFVYLLVIAQLYWKFGDSFSCNIGKTYEDALRSCTDGGVQQFTSGGNVSILVHYATNLPNRDASGPAAGVSDPYVKFTVGDYTAQTSNVRNNLNPHWNELVSIGYLDSATAITVEIWDKDTGLEFSDDLLVRSTLRVPFCSTFMAPYDEVRCGSTFGCESDDSLWHMPRRQQCNETGAINFGRRGVDLYITVYLVPFAMEVSSQPLSSNTGCVERFQADVSRGSLFTYRICWTSPAS
jgi:hypothetical protein